MNNPFKQLSPFDEFIQYHPDWRADEWRGQGDEALANIYDSRTSALVGWWLGKNTGFIPHTPSGIKHVDSMPIDRSGLRSY